MTVPVVAAASVLAAEAFLGEDLLAWLVLAFGGAMVVGTVLALVRPPAEARRAIPAKATPASGRGDPGSASRSRRGAKPGKGRRRRRGGPRRDPRLAPAVLVRSITFIVVGLIAALWALATLLAG